MELKIKEELNYPTYTGPLFKCEFCEMMFISEHFLQKHQPKCVNLLILCVLKSKLNLISCNNEIIKQECLFGKLKQKLQAKLNHSIFKERLYSCSICSLNFLHLEHLNDHMEMHPENNFYKCIICSAKFNTKMDLLSHIRIFHPREENEKLRKPMKMKIPRVERIKKPIEQVHKCQECNKILYSKRYLIEHIKRIHEKQKNYFCEKCNKSFYSKKDFSKHIVSFHEQEKGIRCDFCSKTFPTRTRLLTHKKIHTGERPFKCPTCQKSFTSAANLAYHIGGTHEGTREGFPCEICNKVLSSKFTLINHQRIHTGEKPFECSECKLGFRLKSSLEKHMQATHSECSFKCDLCPKTFSCKVLLRRHIERHQLGRPIECNFCEKTFKLKRDLHVHIKFVHQKVRPFKCNQCNKGFSQNLGLEVHIKTVHQKERNFLCEICSKVFGQKSTLKRHIKMHHPDEFQAILD